jgi:hypothetical protein
MIIIINIGLAENLRKETECPVCLQEMMGRVWQCMAGHIICEVCHDRREVGTGFIIGLGHIIY